MHKIESDEPKNHAMVLLKILALGNRDRVRAAVSIEVPRIGLGGGPPGLEQKVVRLQHQAQT